MKQLTAGFGANMLSFGRFGQGLGGLNRLGLGAGMNRFGGGGMNKMGAGAALANQSVFLNRMNGSSAYFKRQSKATGPAFQPYTPPPNMGQIGQAGGNFRPPERQNGTIPNAKAPNFRPPNLQVPQVKVPQGSVPTPEPNKGGVNLKPQDPKPHDPKPQASARPETPNRVEDPHKSQGSGKPQGPGKPQGIDRSQALSPSKLPKEVQNGAGVHPPVAPVPVQTVSVSDGPQKVGHEGVGKTTKADKAQAKFAQASMNFHHKDAFKSALKTPVTGKLEDKWLKANKMTREQLHDMSHDQRQVSLKKMYKDIRPHLDHMTAAQPGATVNFKA